MGENEKEMPVVNIGEQVKIRRDKLSAMQEEGKDPFTITKFDVTHHSLEAKKLFEDQDAEMAATLDPSLDEEAKAETLKELHEGSKIEVTVAGRMMLKRVMGKASFATVSDLQGNIQIYVTRDALGVDDYQAFKKYDIGDIIGVKGYLFRTRTGEISIHAESLTLLSKSLRPLPEKFHGLTDTEVKYRQRYIDLISNPESRETFVKRSKIIKEIRNFLDSRNFMEVETPILVSNAGGAAARPFETHYNALDEDVKLRISLELYLKRLIVGGLERVYEIGRVFRNEGIDTRHNPEFTLMELSRHIQTMRA